MQKEVLNLDIPRGFTLEEEEAVGTTVSIT